MTPHFSIKNLSCNLFVQAYIPGNYSHSFNNNKAFLETFYSGTVLIVTMVNHERKCCYPLLPLVTSVTPLLPLLHLDTPVTPITPCYPCHHLLPLLPLLLLVTPVTPCYLCYPLLPLLLLVLKRDFFLLSLSSART